MRKMLTKTVTLNNGVKMPIFGFGSYKVEDGKQAIEAIKYALTLGYRHIDTASFYDNETLIAQAIKESGIPREEIFITSKVWNDEQGYESTLQAFEQSIQKLGTDYLDLYLIHWPKPISHETWRALEKLYTDGRIRAIGVSNFKEHHLQDLLSVCQIRPTVNQIEYHPRLSQPSLIEFCQKNDIQVEAWGPLMRGKIFEIEELQQLAKKYHKSVAQIVLRWDIQNHVVTIPKSINPARIKENMEISDFELSNEDMSMINSLNLNEHFGDDPDDIYNL